MKHNRPCHPADLTARVELARALGAARIAAGLTVAAYAARLGVNPSVPWKFEANPNPNPSVGVLIRYGEPLGLQLSMALTGTDEPRPRYHRRRPGGQIVLWLREVREQRRLTGAEVARRGGWSSEAAFRNVENGAGALWLSTIQRYGRALDCPVKVWWESC